MGKGGKGKPKAKQPTPDPSPEPEEEDNEEDNEEEEIDEDEEVSYQDDDADEEEKILQKIEQEIIEADEPVKLTWAALKQLKKQEKQLNDQMDQEMRKIAQKYDILKKPIFENIAKAASGDPVDKELYTKSESTKGLNLNTLKPARVPGYWLEVLQSVSLIFTEEDKQVMESCTKMVCRTEKKPEVDEEINTVQLYFEPNDYIKNQCLKLRVHRKQISVEVEEMTTLQFQDSEQGKAIAQNKEDMALFEIFNPSTDNIQLFSYANDFQRAYDGSLYFYFVEGTPGDGSVQSDDRDSSQNSDSDSADRDGSDSGKQLKPIKKRKPNNATTNGVKPAQQKPQCKNQ